MTTFSAAYHLPKRINGFELLFCCGYLGIDEVKLYPQDGIFGL